MVGDTEYDTALRVFNGQCHGRCLVSSLNADGNRLNLYWNEGALNCDNWNWNDNANDNVGSFALMV